MQKWYAVDLRARKVFGFDTEADAQAKVDELIAECDSDDELDDDDIAILAEGGA